jgi:hypothetical protein
MKCIAFVAVGSLLATPVVFAQSAPRSVLPASATAPKAESRETDFYETRPDGSSAAPKDSLQDTDIQAPPLDSKSTPRGSFEGTGSANLKGSFEGTDSQDVQTAFQDGTSGA